MPDAIEAFCKKIDVLLDATTPQPWIATDGEVVQAEGDQCCGIAKCYTLTSYLRRPQRRQRSEMDANAEAIAYVMNMAKPLISSIRSMKSALARVSEIAPMPRQKSAIPFDVKYTQLHVKYMLSSDDEVERQYGEMLRDAVLKCEEMSEIIAQMEKNIADGTHLAITVLSEMATRFGEELA